MSYNKHQFKQYVNTAGKITVITALAGVVVFTLIFLLNIGAKEFKQATAQGVATTSVTVLNTPPSFQSGPFESPESSTSSPTNSGSAVTWAATGFDNNDEDYYLLVCDGETASPTANTAAPPTCDSGDVTWGVSGLTNSGVQATVSTTTLEAFAESNTWFAWVCDAVAVNPRCNSYAQQGTGSTSSPFNVNHRPVFTDYYDDSPADPGSTVIFTSTSSDSDTTGTQDTVQLHVCSTNSFSGGSCDANTLATSTLELANATATYPITIPFQDDDYDAFGFIVDNHGHTASGGSQGSNSTLTVNNVAPTISGAQIVLNGGLDMTLVTEGGETTGFALQFTATDANSCDAVGGNSYDEISDYTMSVFRSGIGSSTCDGSAGSYNANNCYPSGIATTTWNYTCTASTTSCTFGVDGIDQTLLYDCTFPLWYIADPTDGAATNTVYFAEDWRAGVSASDDDFATSTFVQSTTAGIDVESLLALNLLTATIPYGPLEPGDDSGTLTASTTVESTGNVGLDEELSGESMCGTYTTGSPCNPSATSTIPENEQEYATSTIAYGSGTDLSSTTPAILDINVPKSTSTSTPSSGVTYWGIRVPGTITLAGSYTGENTFTAVTSAPGQW